MAVFGDFFPRSVIVCENKHFVFTRFSFPGPRWVLDAITCRKLEQKERCVRGGEGGGGGTIFGQVMLFERMCMCVLSSAHQCEMNDPLL